MGCMYLQEKPSGSWAFSYGSYGVNHRLLQHLCSLLQLLDDGNVLGTYAFALAALDAVAGLALAPGGEAVVALGPLGWVFMALNTPGMGMPWGQPFTQYWQLVQGMLGRLTRASRAWATTACSWAERGLNSFMVARFCSICSKVDMPESTVIIPSKEAAKRSAQEGRFFSGAAAFSTWARPAGRP